MRSHKIVRVAIDLSHAGISRDCGGPRSYPPDCRRLDHDPVLEALNPYRTHHRQGSRSRKAGDRTRGRARAPRRRGLEHIRSGQHWRDWTLVAAGFAAGRARSMREAMTNQAIGRRYNEAFGRWMDRNPWSRKIDKGTRNHLLWIADNLPAVEAWRETLAANQRDAWNHPTSIKRHYEQAIRVAEIKGPEASPRPRRWPSSSSRWPRKSGAGRDLAEAGQGMTAAACLTCARIPRRTSPS